MAKTCSSPNPLTHFTTKTNKSTLGAPSPTSPSSGAASMTSPPPLQPRSIHAELQSPAPPPIPLLWSTSPPIRELPSAAERGPRFLPRSTNFSEYTPYEDVGRSLQFERDMLGYREPHCLEGGGKRLRCCVPALYGYKRPFRWLKSRGMVCEHAAAQGAEEEKKN